MKIGIIGAGKWGSSINYMINSSKHDVIITSRRKRNEISNFRSLEEVLDCEFIIVVISSQIVEEYLKKKFKYKGQKVLIASKGISEKSNKFLFDIFNQYIPSENLVYLSGPSFADEVLKNKPTALVFNGKNTKLTKKFASFFPSYIKTYTSKDVIGAEICGAYKNILAIASGICDGLELGSNARATLISRGLVEMNRFGSHFKAKKKTFLGLSGAGDLFLTASSSKSRNYRVGYQLAKGKKIDNIIDELGEVAEGVKTANAIFIISTSNKIYTPIAKEVYLALNGKDLVECINDLMK